MELQKAFGSEKSVSFRLLKCNRILKLIVVFFILLTIVFCNFIGTKAIKAKGYNSLLDFSTTFVLNYLNGRNANPEEISIEIKDKDLKVLEQNRNQALERGLIINDLDGDYVKATFQYKGSKIKVKLRLKGHMTDHLQDNKWSFRIKVTEKDETFMGMKRFSIQHPGTRGYIYEWIYHELMKREDVIALRYKFINVSVNGKDWGIYAVEENFENELIENNNRLKGPILRFNPDMYWVNRYNENTGTYSVDEFASYYSANPEAYRDDIVLKDSLQKQYYLKAIALFEGLRNRKISVDKAFDIPRLAKFHAIIDLVGGIHSIDWSDIKYYYNPVTAKLEPLAYESFTNLENRELSAQYKYVSIDSLANYEDWHSMIFSNPIFYKEYTKQLERVSKPNYLDAFFSENNNELKENLSIINKEFPYKKFDKQDYYKHQQIICKILNPPKAIHAYLNRTEGDLAIIQIGSIDALPVHVYSITINDKVYKAKTEIIIPCKQKGEYVNYKNYEFEWNKDVIVDYKQNELKVNYSILGSSKVMQTKVYLFPHTDSEFISDELKNKVSTINTFANFKVDENNKLFILNSNKLLVDKDLIIPIGYKLVVKSATLIDIINGAKIISYSPVIFLGEEDLPIIVQSSDKSGQGLQVISAGKSILRNVVFKNLPKIKNKQWKQSGAITFYESDVEITNCNFYDCKSEDAVNLIRSKFVFKQCLFKDIKDDALDLDYSKGIIENCVFENCKENAIDIMKTNVKMRDVYIDGASNKAISVKDGSELIGEVIRITNAMIAISAEDFSNVNLRNAEISNSKIGVVAYKNKPSADHATIKLNAISFKNVEKKYLKEKKSYLSINNKEVSEEVDDVEAIIKNGKKNKK